VTAKRIGIEEARINLGEILNRTRYKGETFLIARHGEPLALLIPFDSIPTVHPAVPQPKNRWLALARMVPATTKT
jgi:prevent-host-death family protein